MLEYTITAAQAAGAVGAANTRSAEVLFDISASAGPNERLMNPAELLLSAFAACVLKNVERYAGILSFAYERAEIVVRGARQDAPPRMISVAYTLTLWTSEPEHRVQLLQRNLEKYGTVYNTLAASAQVNGEIRVIAPPASAAP